ncbi:outer membrane receptor protein involved in Fe transport [Sphingomonas sp. SORGH_AS870]|uniref:TonB-dependent receptor domain-containing protein n=1 Tax=unclassified Sphingomonas TaxID=196159 RepID=UPI0028546FA9|nr:MULTISPECIES: TonB-dependent receptor [unclassified Sphingomonas]MDR6113741.1 outer membrane receptor protein involved in Fe transport [Sphingomonas sp. SORGH_AS_0789]MDR6145154.1 outer membrane receptor protein involved in Fe transport [Sphingomonas sp. SORGH_AS_0870]MDR6148899.1 outer membrane receptor protein involved in Fe transport [Sphingomonas sp. SORGH_AS_0742]
MTMRTLLGASALASTLVLLPVAALAQTATSETTATQPQEGAATDPNVTERDEQAKGDVIVTGSRLARPNLDSPTPVTSVTAELLTSTGNLNIGDSLNQLPALRSTYSQANSTRFIGTAGLNLLDLRGLGTSRTLVVVNGRRHVTAQPGSFVIDTNTIPTELLERVDVVTGGSSAVYGSDAMAGVVNFVLKRNFEGIRATGQSGVSSHGTRGSYFGALTVGKNFAEGRGNIAAAAEYSFSDVVYYTDRDDITGAYSGRSQFNAVQNTGPQLNPNGGPIRTTPESSLGDGIPDTAFLRNVRNNTISEGGLFTASCPTVAATGESAAAFAARRGVACSGLANIGSSNTLSQYGRTFVFNPDGTLTANNCVTDLRPFGSGNCVGGQGSTLRLNGMLQPKLERFSGNILAHFDVSDAFKPFVEAKYVRIDALQEGQPTFANNTFSINNPFLSSQARATLVSALAPGATTFTAQRFNVDFGGRGEVHRRETFRIVGGVEGDFAEGWHYEVSANYGRLDTFYKTNGNYVTQKYLNSINAVRNAAGQIVCGINADASTANDDAACVPVNLFGSGQVSQAALNYFSITSTRKQKAEQFDLVGFVNGTLFRLPGGDVTFSLGGEYRRETAYSKYDDLTASGATFLNSIPTFAPPAYDIKEAFGEISVPLLADRPFFHELTLTGAARVSHYNVGNAGTPWTYNVNAIWSPIRDITFRGGYARSVRAPSLSELYAASSQTFAQPSDPCSQNNINNNPNRVRNCAAAGVPTTQTFNGTTEPFTNNAASSIYGFNRGNSALQAEKSRSFTIGTVIQPQAIRGFSLTVDYYNITIKDAIFSLPAQTIINQCYDNPSGINNPFCAAVFRNPNGTFAGQQNVIHGGATVSFPTTGPSFFSQGFNYAKLETSGIDIDASYRTKISDTGTLTLRLLASYMAQNNGYTDVGDPTFRDRYKGELGFSAWRGQFVGNLNFETFDIQYRLRYEGKSTVAAEYETQNSYDGRPARNPDAFPVVWYPEAFYHAIQVGFNATERFRFYVGVDNVTDKKPPYDLLGVASGDPYDNIGRFFYAGFKANF